MFTNNLESILLKDHVNGFVTMVMFNFVPPTIFDFPGCCSHSNSVMKAVYQMVIVNSGVVEY